MLEKKIFRLSDKISKFLSIIILLFIGISFLDIDFQSKLYIVTFISTIVAFVIATVVKYSIIIKRL